MNRDSVVGIETWLRDGRSAVRILTGAIYFFLKNSGRALRLRLSPIQWVSSFSGGKKRQWSAILHLSPSSAENKNVWNYTSTPPIRPHGMYRNKFIFTARDNDTIVEYP